MNRRAVRYAAFVAITVIATGACAGTEVIKCTDKAGRITLTDQPCKGAAERVAFGAPAAEPGQAPPHARYGAPARYRLSALPPPAPLMRRRAPDQARAHNRALARDVATLKEARRNLLLIDGTRATVRPSLAARP